MIDEAHIRQILTQPMAEEKDGRLVFSKAGQEIDDIFNGDNSEDIDRVAEIMEEVREPIRESA